MRRLVPFALVLMALAGTPVFAQKCERTDTIAACLDRFVVQAQGDAEAAAVNTTETAATGLTNVGSPAESSLKDFLALLAASMESASSSQQGQAFTFDWNPPLAFTEAIGLKLQASFLETKLNDEVTKSLAANTDELKKLTDSLEFGDDTTLSGFVGRETMQHGRSIVPHRPWFRPMRNILLAKRREEVRAEGRLIDQFGLNQNQQLGNDDNGVALTDQAAVDSRLAAVEALGQQMKESRAAREPFFQAFAKLLNNQPQYYGAAIYHARRNLIGPNEWSGKFTYEYGSNNLNAFRKDTPECQTAAQMATAAADCAKKLTDFANATRPGIERIALSLEYHKVNRRWINDPTAGLDLGYPRTRSFVGSLAFGTNMSPMLPFRTATTGVGDARLDFTAKYELPEDNDSEQEGFVGTLTYTQKISDTFSLPLSLVYSDHESDLINVDKRFSARFGLMYKLPDLASLTR